MYILYNSGDRTEPWGTPTYISLGVNISPLTEIVNFHSHRKELICLIKFTEKFNLCNLYNKPGCHVISKNFSISKNTTTVDMLLLKFNITWSVSLTHCSVSHWSSLYNLSMDCIENTVSKSLSIVVCVSVATETCLPSCYYTLNSFFRLHYSGFQMSCHNI
jgi:hypothetical protein